MKTLGTVSKAKKGGGGRIKFRDSVFAVRCSLLSCISFYKNAEGYLMKAMKVMVIGSKTIWVNQESLSIFAKLVVAWSVFSC